MSAAAALILIPDFYSVGFWLDFGVGIILSVIIICFVWIFVRRWFIRLSFLVGVVTLLAASIFQLTTAEIIAILGLLLLSVITVISNVSDFRPIAANSLKGKQRGNWLNFHSSRKRVQKIFDKEALYHEIALAVNSLSRSKTGAIMTFERKTPLNDFLKNGTMINAPVCSELLVTIFYPGTRLHDGAVVIRDNTILAASVYYTATTKPLSGKYGSRHRAAIGISEITDSVTVVVSEETGRISIAYNGELESVTLDNFPRIFRDYMEGGEADKDA